MRRRLTPALTDPLALYHARVTLGQIRRDDAQLRALYAMRESLGALASYEPSAQVRELIDALAPAPRLGFTSSHTTTTTADRQGQHARELVRSISSADSLDSLAAPRGLILTGEPGTGKTMLLQLIFDCLPTAAKFKAHYHHFLLATYDRIHRATMRERARLDALERNSHVARTERAKLDALSRGWRAVFAGGRDPSDARLNANEFVLAQVAREIALEHGWLLAFDDVQLVDIAGAGIVKRVLEWYWRLGGVVLATSNRLPRDLYNAGVQREAISSFLDALANRCDVVHVASAHDYRRIQPELPLSNDTHDADGEHDDPRASWRRIESPGAYFVNDRAGLESTLRELVGARSSSWSPTVLRVYNRALHVPASTSTVARMSFRELCERPLGAADYLSLASRFGTLVIDDVPVLTLANGKNEARRLITLIDACYETKARVVLNAHAPIDLLFFPDAVHEPPPHADADADSLTQESLGDTLHDLERPYRPNISSYRDGDPQARYDDDELATDLDDDTPSPPATSATASSSSSSVPLSKQPAPHPSASAPSLASLAIFTGDDERFAYRRAVSRLHEMSSAKYLREAVWTPLDPSLRTWETTTTTRPQRESHEQERQRPEADPSARQAVLQDAADAVIQDGASTSLKRPKMYVRMTDEACELV